MNKFFKLKHKPTGLYYTPNKGKGNLSKNGKIYHIKPNLKHISNHVRIRLGYDNISIKDIIIKYFNITENLVDGHYPVDKSDWLIEEFNIIIND